MAITRATYDSYKRRSDRVFGETYEDVNWSGPPIRQIRRRSTGDFFRYTQWNGGYPSYLTFLHNGVMLQTDVKGLFVDDHRYEPIYVIGPAYVMTGPDRRTKRDWTSRELYVIASFFQTKYREAHVSNISMLRANGHHEMADANERAPMARPSVIYEKNVDIASIAELPKS